MYEYNQRFNTLYCLEDRPYEKVELYAQYNFIKHINKTESDALNIVIVGAFNGNEISLYKTLYPNSVIYAFEPQDEAYSRLFKRYGDMPNVKLYNYAISDECGQCKFHRNSGNGMDSLLKWAGEKVGTPEIAGKQEVKKSVRLDSLNFLQNVTIDYLQVDVQGAELKVMKGCSGIMDNINSLMLEVHTRQKEDNCYDEQYEGQCYLEDLLCYLKPFGFSLNRIGINENLSYFNGVGEGNSFWIKND